MELHEIVMKLTGPVEPVGSSHIDDERLENLKKLLDLTSELLQTIDQIASRNKDRVEYSMKRAGKLCDNWLDAEGISNG